MLRFILLKFTYLLIGICYCISVWGDCSSPVGYPGQTRWDSSKVDLLYCDSTEWKSLRYGGFKELTRIEPQTVTSIGSAASIALKGNIAYVSTTSPGGLHILDSNDLDNVVQLSTVLSPHLYNYSSGVAVEGNYAYVVGNRLLIFDVTSSTNPILLSTSSENLGNEKRKLYLHGDHLYVSSYSSFRIYDVSNKSSPSLIKTISTSQGASVYRVGNYLYTLSHRYLRIYDVSDINNPVLVKTIEDNRFSYGAGLVMYQNHLLVLSEGGGYGLGHLSLINIVDPLNPTIVDEIVETSYGEFEGVSDAASLNNIVAAVQSNGRNSENYLTVLDISDERIAKTAVIPIPSNDFCISVAISSSRIACVRGSSAVRFWESETKTQINPKPTSEYFASGYDSNTTIQVKNNKGVVINSNGTLWLYDTTVQNNASLLARSSTLLTASHLSYAPQYWTFDGRYLWLIEPFATAINVFDLANPLNMLKVNTFNDPADTGTGRIIGRQGDYLYVYRDSSLRINIYDVTDPLNPSLVGSYHDGSSFAHFNLRDNDLYLMNSTGLKIVDISNPLSPVLKGSVSTTVSPQSISIDDNYVYVFGYSRKFNIIDISDKANPVAYPEVVNMSLPTSGTMFKVGPNLFVNSTTSRVYINVANPELPLFTVMTMEVGINPLVLSSTELYEINLTKQAIVHYQISSPTVFNSSDIPLELSMKNILATAIKGEYLLTVSMNKISVIDVSIPSSPVKVNDAMSSLISSSANALVDGNYLYVISNYRLFIWDISSLPSINLLGSVYDSRISPFSSPIIIKGNYLYVTNNSNGIVIIDISIKNSPTFVGQVTFPNSSSCNQLVGSGTYLYLSCNSVTSAISISSPASPTLVSQVPVGGTLGVKDNRLYVQTYGLLYAYDITNPSSIIQVGRVRTNKYNATTSWKEFENSFYYLGNSGQMGAISTSNPNQVYPYSALKLKEASGQVFLEKVGNTYIQITAGRGTYSTWESSTDLFFGSLGKTYVNSSPFKSPSVIEIEGQIAYIVNSDSGVLSLVDISDVRNPQLISTLEDYSFISAKALVKRGDYLYIAGNSLFYESGIVDLSDIYNPKLTARFGGYSQTYNAKSILISGNYLFICGQYFTTYDITIPEFPVLVGTPLLNIYTACFFDGSDIIAFNASNIYRIDVSNPASPVQTLIRAQLSSTGFVRKEGNMFITIGYNNIRIYSTPTFDVIADINESRVNSSGGDFYISDNTLVVTSPYHGIYSLDISDFNNVKKLDQFSGPSSWGAYVVSKKIGDNIILLGADHYFALEYFPSYNLGSCTSAGMFSYDTTNNVYGICDGSSIKGMSGSAGAGGPGCSSPTAGKGDLRYFSANSIYRFCDGTNWVDTGNP